MKRFATLILAALLCAVGLSGQGGFKSEEEYNAFMALQNAMSPEDKAAAGGAFVAAYPKSEFFGVACYMTMLSYQQLNDFDSMLLYGEMVLDSDPQPGVLAGTLLSLAGAIPTRTREFDLDKEEKLAKADDYAKRAMALIPTLPKMDPNMSDDEWLSTKMEFMSQSHEAVGIVALKREDYDASVASLRKAFEMAPNPVAFTMYNLAQALTKQGNAEEAAEMAQRCTAAGGVQSADGSDLCASLGAK